MDAVWCHVANAAVAMLVAVPGKEGLAMGPGILNASKALGELGSVRHGLELRLRAGVVIADRRSAVALGHIQIDQQVGHGLGAHGGVPVGVQGQHAGGHVMARDRLGNELLGQLDALPGREHPAHHEAAEDDPGSRRGERLSTSLVP